MGLHLAPGGLRSPSDIHETLLVPAQSSSDLIPHQAAWLEPHCPSLGAGNPVTGCISHSEFPLGETQGLILVT